ncbi:pogo transposable element derived with ZNF domain b isoform X1 [Cheilinus undulatus]|uniref:pogo transposable element derived with ZNF domain b isoform X1 n=1 Tax=Cheilinus undulatus TaxID=241271 RepID=UPI001BD58B6E|nr:pogo transposable element derived with ZNF domain b isoform X1 [Cheilinus undulatus]
MDTELFMECEEEELEPWQQVDDSVEEDDMEFMESYCEPVEDSLSPLPASETPPPNSAPSSTPAPTVSHLTPAVSAPPLVAQAPPLILTQAAGGTFLLPATPGSGNTQPILLTTQGFPVMNHGAPLVLNLQPAQTVQPVTLIQSRSLAPLVRPNVGVSPILPQGQAAQTRTASAPSRGHTQPGSTFTTMQLPTSLTIRTSTPRPVNLQVGGANSLKLGGSPALPSGSANGVSRVMSFNRAPGSAPSVLTTSSVTSAPMSSPPKVVMSVEEFYYGTYEGDLSLRKPHPLGIKTSTFTCQICNHLAQNNLRLMQHMLLHSELAGGGGGVGGDERRKCCKFCFRQFSSPALLKNHQDQVHGPTQSSCMCRICEWAFENEPAFLNHMKSSHKPGEMPYICQVCSYRSSFYSDVLQHFTSFHRDSRFLLCVFCLKVTRNPTTYQQHLLRHQVSQAFHCNRCRLQFVFLKDKMQHKMENHRSFRRPTQLEGLPPGSKVTIRTYGKMRPGTTSSGARMLQSPSPLIQPINIKTEHQKSLSQRSPPSSSKGPRSPAKRTISRRISVNRSLSCEEERLLCLECGTDASDFSAHYPTHVHCLLCPYSSCCSRAYAAHMIHHHVPKSKDGVLPLHRRPPPCMFVLHCSYCGFTPQSADHMAEHLLRNPAHHSAFCRRRAFLDSDIHLSDGEEQHPSEETEPISSQDLPEPSWRSADNWKHLSDEDEDERSKFAVLPFTERSGPRHNLSRNSDAIDFFSLLFPPTLFDLITKETNAHAKICRYLGCGKADWVPVSIHEIKGFLGLVILMGIQTLPDLSHYWSWNHYDNSYTFYRTMTFKRFKQIASNIRMGSFTTDEYRGSTQPADPLHIFRPMLDIVGGAMWNTYKANCCLTIDRALLPTLEDESCSQAPPQVWLLCDSKSGYCHRLFIQGGGQGGREPGFTVVPELVRGLEDKHHQLYLANSLASVPLMQKLLDQGIYASSSFPPPNPILPRALWNDGELEKAGDFLQRQCGPLLATRWRDTKEMGCLSTNAIPGEADTVWRRSQTKVGGLDPIDRPMAFRLLQENMRGVDICKQLLACNPLGGIPQDQHWRSLFWFLVNLCVVNAFIVLRESRKENPPSWVQDGLFTQVNFRKRLGSQLTKCAQKYFETTETASNRPAKTETVEDSVKQRHRMAKVSNISKRCKNCNLKNIRHESVYGCIVCKANLCKQPSCFWEFHGLSPQNKGSTKVGFIKDSVSGAIEQIEPPQGDGDPMAPVEDLDFSDSEHMDDLDDMDPDDEDVNDEFDKEDKCATSALMSAANGDIQPAAVMSASKERDDFLTARQLRIALAALCDGLRQTSRVFSTEPELIRSWLKEARWRWRRTGQEQMTHEGGEERMVAWVMSTREQQLPITESNLFQKASALKRKGAFMDSFRISYDWAVSFMLHHRLGVHSIGRAPSLAGSLPPSLLAKMKTFTDFTQKVFTANHLSEQTVAAMDELSIFLDLRLVQDKSYRSDAVELTGTVPLFTVYISVLADGTMLPSLLLANRELDAAQLPAFIVLEDGAENLAVEDALDIWAKKIWLQYVSALGEQTKSMLVMDRHREHLGDSFLSSISGSGTLPAVIPAGGSLRLQPLEVCMKPVLQRFLLARWTKFTKGNPVELEETSPQVLQVYVAQKLLDWLVEGLTRLRKLPELWRRSFQLTGVLPERKKGGKEDKTNGQKPEEVQTELLKTLTETLLGAKAWEEGSPEVLELEDEEEEEEDVRDVQEKEDEKKKRDNKETEERREEIKDENENSKDEGKEARTEGDKEMNKVRTEENKEAKSEELKETKEARTEGDKETNEARKKEDKEAKSKELETTEARTEGVKEMREARTKEDRTKEANTEEDKTKEARTEDEETAEARTEEDKEQEEDSEEEVKETREAWKEMNKERRETRIVIGEEVGDEWKIKSRTEGGEVDDEDRMDES